MRSFNYHKEYINQIQHKYFHINSRNILSTLLMKHVQQQDEVALFSSFILIEEEFIILTKYGSW